MSLDALRWAFADRSVDDAPARHVLACLAWHANADDLAWPSADTIAGETGYHRRTVIRHLDALEAAGTISRTGRRRRRAIEWHVNVDRNVTEGHTTSEPAGDRNVTEGHKILCQRATQTQRGTNDATANDDAADGLDRAGDPDSGRYDGLGVARENERTAA